MFISRENLKALARSHVCEIKFRRRNPVARKPLFRRMLCTTSPKLLNSLDGRLTLNFRPTTSPPYRNPAYNPDRYNLIIVWDILMQDYRAVNMSYCNLIARIPATDDFWNYFKQNLMKLTSSQKMAWMNS